MKNINTKLFMMCWHLQNNAKKRQQVLPVKKRAFWALVEGVGKFVVYQLS